MEAYKILRVEKLPGYELAQRIFCTVCNEKVFEVSGDPTQEEIDRERVGLAAHLEIRHQITLVTVQCADPNCLKGHGHGS